MNLRLDERPGVAVATPVRLHWIDWLRVAAIAGVFVFHTLRPFNTDDWHVKNADTSDTLNALTTLVASFGLAVFSSSRAQACGSPSASAAGRRSFESEPGG